MMDLKSKLRKIRIGVFLSLLSGLLYASGNVILIPVIPVFSVYYVTAIKYTIQVLLSIPQLLVSPEDLTKINKKEWIFMTLSGIVIGISSYSGYLALTYIPVMDATVIFNANSVIVFIISGIWLKEKIGKLDIAYIIIILVGVVCICQPPFLFGSLNDSSGFFDNSMSWFGYLLALITCISLALATCLVRRVYTVSTPFILIFQGFMIGITFLFIGLAIGEELENKLTTTVWLSSLGGTAVTVLARYSITVALTFENASVVSPVMTIQIFFSLILQVTVFRIIPNWVGVLGAVLVNCGVVLIGTKEQVLILINKCRSKETKEANLDKTEKSLLLPS